MKDKRILLIFLSFALLCSLFTGCKGKQNEDQYVPPEEKTLTLYDPSAPDDAYHLIRSFYAGDEAQEIISELQASIDAAGGFSIKKVDDTSKKTPEQAREIVVGQTTRKESEEVLSRITGVGYRIERVGEKIIIAGSNNEMLKAAANRFAELLQQSGGALNVNIGLIEEKSDIPFLPLKIDGKVPFKVIIPGVGYSDELYSAAQELNTLFGDASTYPVWLDTNKEIKEETEGAYEICIGETNRAASKKLYSELDALFEYRIAIDGNRILLGARLESELLKGVKALRTELARALDYTYAGTPSLALDFGGVYTSSNAGDGFPLPDDGKLTQALDCGRDSFILYYKNVREQSQYEAYIQKLLDAGAEITATYAQGDNVYTLFHSDTYTSYISYMPSQRKMQIYIGSPSDVNPSTEPVEDAKLVSPKLWQFEVDVFAGGADGGMSYAVQLTDGKFLIFDGGYSASDARNLYETMNANKPASHEKPIVAGWFISHLHGDHYNGLVGMANHFADKIEVEAFYYNFPYVTMGDEQKILPSYAYTVESAMKKWPRAVRYGRLHTGEAIYFSGATANVLATLEDTYTHSDGNDTSTVIRLDIAGQRILFLGDTYLSESVPLAALGSEVLKSDIVQFSHHGYFGASKSVYLAADPETILWPLNILGVELDKRFETWYLYNTDANVWARKSESVKKIIVSGAGTVCLNLPYEPTGERIVDYEKVYKQKLAEYNATH